MLLPFDISNTSKLVFGNDSMLLHIVVQCVHYGTTAYLRKVTKILTEYFLFSISLQSGM